MQSEKGDIQSELRIKMHHFDPARMKPLLNVQVVFHQISNSFGISPDPPFHASNPRAVLFKLEISLQKPKKHKCGVFSHFISFQIKIGKVLVACIANPTQGRECECSCGLCAFVARITRSHNTLAGVQQTRE